MRPRVFPAEDLPVRPAGSKRAYRASMRPRVFPAEDGRVRFHSPLQAWASMRPRVFPAEDDRFTIDENQPAPLQ